MAVMNATVQAIEEFDRTLSGRSWKGLQRKAIGFSR